MFIRGCGGRKKSEKFVSTKGSVTVTAIISGVGIKVVSGTAVYAAGTAEGTSFTTAKLPNGTYEVVVSKAGYDDVVVPVVVNGDVAVTAELKNVSLAVSSVKAINAMQIEVKFNNIMDRATVEKTDNFKIEAMNTQDVGFPTRDNIEDITLQDDAQTAIITLNTPMTNGYEYEVTAYKEIKSAAGKNLTEKSVTKVVSNDSTRPTTTSIKTLAPNLLQVTFSEPVEIYNTSNNIEFVTVDSTGKELNDVLNPVVTGEGVVSISNGRTSYVIRLNKNLKQGSNYNLYVGGGNGISDYAGLRLTAEKHTFTYEADKEVTAVKNFTLLDGKTAKVTFTKPIKVDPEYREDIKVYYNADGVQGNRIATGKVNESSDAQSIKVTFDKLIPGGVKYFFVDGAYDLAGNKVEIGKFNVTIPEYKTAEVSSVKLTNKTIIEVEFNQEIDDEKSYFKDVKPDGSDKDEVTAHNNKVRANIVLKDKDGKNVDIKDIKPGKDSKGNYDYAKRVITLYKDLGDGNNTLTIDNLVDELGRAVVSYKGTVSYANSTEFSAKLKAGKTEDDDKTVAVLSIDESKAVPTQASVENLKNWTVDTTYGKKTLAEVSGAKVKMVSNDVYVVEADKDAFKAGSAVVLSNLETAAGLTIPSTTVDAGDAVNDIKSLAEAKGDMLFDGTTATINLNNVIIGSFSPSDFIFEATKKVGDVVSKITPNDYTVSYSNDTAKDAFASKIIVKLNNNVTLASKTGIVLKTAERTSTTDVFGRKLQANAAISIQDTSKAAVVGSYITETQGAAKIVIKLDRELDSKLDSKDSFSEKDFTVVTKDSKQALKVDSATASTNELTITLETLTGKTYEDILEKEEVSVSFNKKLSTADDVASSMSATTDSLRLTKISFGAGKSTEQLDGEETITFTYNKTLNQDLLKDIDTKKDVVVSKTDSGQTIATELGSFVLSSTDKLFAKDGNISTTYEISGKTIVLKLIGLGKDYEAVPSKGNPWNLVVTYSHEDATTNINELTLNDVEALDGTKAAVSTKDVVINDASNLTTGEIISYKAVDDAVKAYKDSLKVFNSADDVKAAEVAQTKAKNAILKTSDSTQKYYNDDVIGDIDKDFTKFSNIFNVYSALTASKLESLLNAGTALPKSANDNSLLGSESTNDATIKYVDMATDSDVVTDNIIKRPEPEEGSNTVNIKVTITSGDKDQDVVFKVTVPAKGDIKVENK